MRHPVIFSFLQDVRDDVGGPIKHKMKGILVRTGKFREGDEHKIYPLKVRTNSNTQIINKHYSHYL